MIDWIPRRGRAERRFVMRVYKPGQTNPWPIAKYDADTMAELAGVITFWATRPEYVRVTNTDTGKTVLA